VNEVKSCPESTWLQISQSLLICNTVLPFQFFWINGAHQLARYVICIDGTRDEPWSYVNMSVVKPYDIQYQLSKLIEWVFRKQEPHVLAFNSAFALTTITNSELTTHVPFQQTGKEGDVMPSLSHMMIQTELSGNLRHGQSDHQSGIDANSWRPPFQWEWLSRSNLPWSKSWQDHRVVPRTLRETCEANNRNS